MIRRMFWLVVGAVAGIFGYRRVTAIGRKVHSRTAVGWARETAKFARDVREGMDLYKTNHDVKDGR